MTDFAALEKGLLAYLRTCPAGVMVGGRVIIDFAKANTLYPHLLMSLNAERGPDEQRRRSGDYRYTIKAVVRDESGVDGLKLAHDIAAALDEALNEQQAQITLDAPWVVYRVERVGLIGFTEQKDMVQYRHRGGVYRIRVSEEL